MLEQRIGETKEILLTGTANMCILQWVSIVALDAQTLSTVGRNTDTVSRT